jgi:hypothetical protein
MDVHIEEMSSKVQAADSRALMTPDLMRQIVQAVLAAMQVAQVAESRRQAERRPQAGSVAQPHPWEK